MSNIGKAFENGTAFIAFLTGGDPSLDKSYEYIMEMVRAGADLIEIGIPFSDPIAEGPVIQEANLRALKGGATTDGMFRLARRVRQDTQTPLVFLTYLNPVFHYGYGRFFAQCEESGVDGVIVPDLPYEEQPELLDIATRHGVDIISLVAPTSRQRIQKIAKDAAGFVYVVSSMGVTGMRASIQTDLAGMVKMIRAATDIPCAVGFGVNTPEQAKEIAGIADGVIVGSAIVERIAQHGGNAHKAVFDYVKQMKDAIR